jgi:hypothetical protein
LQKNNTLQKQKTHNTRHQSPLTIIIVVFNFQQMTKLHIIH